MKKLLSILLAAVLLCGTAYAAPSKARLDEQTASKAEPITAMREVGGAKEMIRTMSSKTAARFEEVHIESRDENETYNEYDVAKMREFLEIEDENGVKNGEKIVRIEGDYYDPDDPSTWSCLGWTEDGYLQYITFWSGNFAEYDGEYPMHAEDLLVGTLDVSGMQELIDVNIPENLIDGVIADDCPNLEMLYCGNQFTLFESRCTVVSVKNCPNLWYVGADYCNNLSSVEIDGCSSLIEIMMNYTPHLASINIEDCKDCMEMMSFGESGIKNVDLSNMQSLISAQFDDCPLTTVNLSGNVSEFELSVSGTEVNELDLSDCINVYGLYIYDTPMTMLDIRNCNNLQALVCYETDIQIIDASHAEQIYYVNTMMTPSQQYLPNQDAIAICPYGNDLRLKAENGKIGIALSILYFGQDAVVVGAAPSEEGSDFLGWYDEESGTLVSEEMHYSFDEAMINRMQNENISLVARFSKGEEPLLGDINGDGEVTVADAILALRCAMGILELTPEQIEAGDMNESGAIEVSDAIIILRTAMGLLG
ncbi:MAG: hypothetical protein IJM20_04055 [Clostridia bacterium]|nr:hypothetical protein [Clostridia bacterium]